MKTRKIRYGLLAMLLISLTAQAKNINDFFIDMPEYLLPTLENSYRLELIENYQNKGTDTIQNSFGTIVRLTSEDDINRHIGLQTAPNARFEMQLFTQDSDTVIGIINTVCVSQLCSSYIKFYDTKWNELKTDFPYLTANNWLESTQPVIDGVKITDMIKASFIEYTFDPDNNSIEAKNNSLDFLNENDRELLEPYFSDRNIVIKWNDNFSSLRIVDL